MRKQITHPIISTISEASEKEINKQKRSALKKKLARVQKEINSDIQPMKIIKKEEKTSDLKQDKTCKTQFWRLARLLHTRALKIYMCQPCANALYRNKDKLHETDTGVQLMFDLCKECARSNMDLNTLIANWDKKQAQKMESIIEQELNFILLNC